MHQANIRTPGDVTDPIAVTSDRSLKRGILAAKLPELNLVVISSSDDSLGRRLEFSILTSCCCRVGALVGEDGRFSGWTPADSINSSLVSDEILGLLPCVVLIFLENDYSTFSSASCQNESVLPRSPGDAINR